MAEHTSGPWTEWHNEKGGFTISDRIGLAVLCQRSDWDKRAAESIANGRLIAAAPNQHAALCTAPRPPVSVPGNEIAGWIVEYMDWYFKTRGAAIAKAEGLPISSADHHSEEP